MCVVVNIDRVSDIPHIYFPGEYDEPSLTVLESVAWAKGVQPDQLTPLQQVIDTDALNELFDGTNDEPASPHRDLELSFRYAGCRVVVEEGEVWVDRD